MSMAGPDEGDTKTKQEILDRTKANCHMAFEIEKTLSSCILEYLVHLKVP